MFKRKTDIKLQNSQFFNKIFQKKITVKNFLSNFKNCQQKVSKMILSNAILFNLNVSCLNNIYFRKSLCFCVPENKL